MSSWRILCPLPESFYKVFSHREMLLDLQLLLGCDRSDCFFSFFPFSLAQGTQNFFSFMNLDTSHHAIFFHLKLSFSNLCKTTEEPKQNQNVAAPLLKSPRQDRTVAPCNLLWHPMDWWVVCPCCSISQHKAIQESTSTENKIQEQSQNNSSLKSKERPPNLLMNVAYNFGVPSPFFRLQVRKCLVSAH